MILMINDRFYNEQEIRQLIQSQADELKDLREENKVLISECDRLIKEKGELLKKSEQIAKYKSLLKLAVEDFNKSLGAMYTCPYCKYVERKREVCASRKEQYCGDICEWRYADEALKLIGEDGEQNG